MANEESEGSDMKKGLSLLTAIMLVCVAFAQDQARLVLLDGTPVRLRTAENLSSHDAVKGSTVDFEVMEDIYVNNVLVAKKGGTAIGTITDASPKKTMGRGGKLDITIDYLRLVDGEKAQLRGVKEGKGGGHTGAMTGAMVATAIVVWPVAPLFLFMHGKDINIPKGTAITAYIDGDFNINGTPSSAPTLSLAPAAAPQAPSQAPVATAPALQATTLSSGATSSAAQPHTQVQTPVCVSVVIDAKGNETCARYSDQK
jgi:hypothetical protein